MVDTKKILDSIKDKIPYEPIDDRILIKPLKQKTIKKAFKVPTKVENNLVGAEHQEVETKEEVREVPTNCQLGVVLKVDRNSSNLQFTEGDIIVYPTNPRVIRRPSDPGTPAVGVPAGPGPYAGTTPPSPPLLLPKEQVRDQAIPPWPYNS